MAKLESPKALVALAFVLGLVTGACDASHTPDGESVAVVATTTIWGDVVKSIGGDEVTVEVLTPVGADPHDFQASASQVAHMNEADLVVANGLGLEEGLIDVLAAALTDGAPVFEVAPMLDPLPFGLHTKHEADVVVGADEDHEEGGQDPHVWLDPVRVADAAVLIAGQLADVEPRVDWMSRARVYAEELLTVDAEMTVQLSAIPEGSRSLVTNHDALGYFADRYEFSVVGVVIPGGSTLGDPSSGELARLVDVMRREGVDVIFGETTEPPRLADAVAAELGGDVRVVSLYTGSLGEAGSGADTLIGMLQTNSSKIVEALG